MNLIHLKLILSDTLIFSHKSFDRIILGDYTIHNYEIAPDYNLRISYLGTEDRFTFYKKVNGVYFFPHRDRLRVIYEKKIGVLFENDIRLAKIITACFCIASVIWIGEYFFR